MWKEAVYPKLRYKPGSWRHAEEIFMKLKIKQFHYYNLWTFLICCLKSENIADKLRVYLRPVFTLSMFCSTNHVGQNTAKHEVHTCWV